MIKWNIGQMEGRCGHGLQASNKIRQHAMKEQQGKTESDILTCNIPAVELIRPSSSTVDLKARTSRATKVLRSRSCSRLKTWGTTLQKIGTLGTLGTRYLHLLDTKRRFLPSFLSVFSRYSFSKFQDNDIITFFHNCCPFLVSPRGESS